MQTARLLARRLHGLLRAEVPGRRTGPVWKLNALTLNRALSYDISVSPPGSIESHAVELDALVAGVARECVDPTGADRDDEWEAALRLLRQPRTRGGLDLTAAQHAAPYAYLSTAIAALPPQVAAATAHGRDRGAVLAGMRAAGIVAQAELAQRRIEEDGVYIDEWGMPREGAPLGADRGGVLDVADAIAAGVGMYHRRRAWAEKRADLILDGLPPDKRAHRWTHGGEEGGLGFTANASPDLSPWLSLIHI